jgi:thymidylate kinase
MLITFSGLDGSGKSTLVGSLKHSLEQDNRKVAVSHMNYGIGLYSAMRLLRNGVSRNKRPESHAPRELAYENKFQSRVAKVRYLLVWNKSLRLLVYPVDVFIFLCYRFYVEKLKQQVLIMDRYFYDTLVDVTEARRSLRLRFLSWLTPRPTLPVYLDISPEKAFARKNEYSVDYLNRRRLSYHKLLSDLPGVLILSTESDLDTTRSTVTSAIRERMVAI